MKNAKKIVLLLLSLALLCGIFAVAALAEEPASTATVVYPDGSVATVAVGDAIVPKTFTDGLYYGEGNTLYKDDATEGWIFTVDGAALADLTVTEAMAGKKIIASGADKVYYVSEEKISKDSDEVTTVYHLVDDVDKFMSSSNTGDRGDGTNTGAHSREVLGNKATHYVKLKLYEDVVTTQFNMILMPDTRQHTAIPLYFDLNGHNVVNNYTGSTTEVKGTEIWIYSSMPGAHWYQPNSGTMFYASDDGTVVLGSNASDGTYADNISFHCKLVGHTHYGNGMFIYGGRYYQLAGGAEGGFVSITRRIQSIQNAKFYPLAGSSVFADEVGKDYYATAKGEKAIKGCTFYGADATPILSSKQDAKLLFENCTFYGVTAEVNGTGSVTATTDAGNTFENAVTYKTVTWFDGTTSKYLAASLDEAKAFVESHPKFLGGAYEVKDGNELSVVFDPVYSVAYDDSFNATVTRGGEATKVYYTVTLSDGTVEYYTGEDYAASLSSLFGKFPAGATITLYADLTQTSATMASTISQGTAYLDLNGHLWTLTGTGSPVLEIGPTNGKNIKFYLYSSQPGGKLSAPKAGFLTRTNSYGTAYFGERDTSKTQYGANLTVETTCVNGDLYGSGIGIYGGTYIQVASSSYNYLFIVSRINATGSQFFAMQNATFVLNKANSSAIHYIGSGFNSITNCTFVANTSGATAICNASTTPVNTAKAPTFDGCKFINVNPVASLLGDKYPIYKNCVFSLEDAITAPVYSDGTTATPLYLARINATDSISYNGASYPVNYALVEAGKYLTVVWTDGTHPYWALGSKPLSDTSVGDTVEKQADGSYMVFCDNFQYPVGFETVAEEHLGQTATELAVAAGRTIPIAFSYQVDGGKINYAELLDTPEANGEQFATILNDLINVKIVMYTDIVLNRGVLFGTLMDYTDQKGKVVQILNQSGNVDWDLNGQTVTVSADATPLAMVSERESQGAQTVNVLHYVKAATFKLYSSVAGGQYINNSNHAIFGGLKYTDSASSYILGTSDLAVDGGDNLTVISNGTITAAYENQASGPAGVMLGINGGTYVYNGTGAAFNTAVGTQVKNAKIATTGAALAVFINQYWANATFYAENITVGCASKSTYLVESGTLNAIGTNSGKTYSVSLNGVLMAGGTLNGAYGNNACIFTITGDVYAGDADSLAVVYPTAPEGKALAYTSVEINGTYYKYLGYYTAPTTVNVKNEVTGAVEAWLVGSVHVAGGDISALHEVVIDGKLYYRPNPTWSYTLDGAVITDPCAAENAGKTVLLVVGGETIPVIFTAAINGAITYYTDAETAGNDFKALITPAGTYTYEIKLYSDLVTPIQTFGKKGTTSTYKIDANGYTLRFAKTTENKASYVLFTNTNVYLYSTVAGGAFDFGDCKAMACCDSSGHGYFGEPVNDGSATYGKNVTFYFDSLHGYMYSSGLAFIGGTYVQVENAVSTTMADGTNTGYPTIFRNSTFVFKKADAIFYGACFGNGGKIVNCNFICEEPTNLFRPIADKDKATIFENCKFYNVVPNLLDKTVTYTDCLFNQPSAIAQAGGYIAGTATDEMLTVLGETYTFCAKLLPLAELTPIKAGADAVVYFETASFDAAFAQGKFVTVDWGFGLDKEYWAIGSVATHENVTVDGIFVYKYVSFVVGSENMTAEATLESVVTGNLLMGLEVQNTITFKIYIPKSAGFERIDMGGVVTVLDETAAVEGDYYVISATYSPSKAADAVAIALIGAYSHSFSLTIEDYANAVLGDETQAAAHNLVYALIEYVELMAGCDVAVAAPAGYEAVKLVGVESTNGVTNDLTMFSLLHDEELYVALIGTASKTVEVRYANNATANALISDDGTVMLPVASVSALAGEFSFTVEGESYTYSLANYLFELQAAETVDEAVVAKLKGLYNYAYYADLYIGA